MANVLLVLGNGFDLACGLKSSFGDYLDSDFYKPQMDNIASIDNSLKAALRSPAYHGNTIFYYYPFTFDENLTFWDMYFGLSKKVGGDLWCDFETSMKKHIDESHAYADGINIYDFVQMDRVGKNTYADDKFRNDLLLWKYVEQNKLDDKILLNHLKIYEHRFGKYIYEQQKNSADYVRNAKLLVSSILNAVSAQRF